MKFTGGLLFSILWGLRNILLIQYQSSNNNIINNYNSENEYEENYSDPETLDKRNLWKTKEKDIKFYIKRNNIIFHKQENKNDKIDNQKNKKLSKRKRKNY